MRWTETYSDNSTASFSATRNNGDIEQIDPDSPLSQIAFFQRIGFL
ncbi:MAG: hypothetical protein IPM77_14265 [Crocinitomicaceae bacterium]|nr:hypothetical protein [Crocinitomicaceae bacterium]